MLYHEVQLVNSFTSQDFRDAGHAIVKMVTSNKLPDKRIVKMAEQNNSVVVPQRTLLGEVNEHITCPLCRGYYIDATTIVECLHSFCRSCIIKHLQAKSYCPVCEMMINSNKPNIKLDKALQDIVYKLVPGLFQREMERRQQFYASRPGPAASATPEQRGEDTERIIFSPEDVISFSLEYADATDTDSISSKSSDSNEPQPQSSTTRRYLQCPAVVNISHLKKFLSMKFDIDSTQFAIDILYKRVPLPDYYTLMDIAYIYNWKRNEPMRFFYQIIDFVAIRNRLFDINRKGTHFRDRKSSPASTEDTNISSPTPNLNDQGSEASSGTDSPMPEESVSKQSSESSKKSDKCHNLPKIGMPQENKQNKLPTKKNDDEVEKSQFLISFELTAKNSSSPKTSPNKVSKENETLSTNSSPNNSIPSPSILADEPIKRKPSISPSPPETKRFKIEAEKDKISDPGTPTTTTVSTLKTGNSLEKSKEVESPSKPLPLNPTSSKPSANNISCQTKGNKHQTTTLKHSTPESPIHKKASTQNISSPKHKLSETNNLPVQSPGTTKTVSPLKLQIPRSEAPSSGSRVVDTSKPVVKKIPDLKPGVPLPQSTQSKAQPVNKVRMDLLSNNCDPTMDRSKILSQVKTSMNISHNTSSQQSGDPLKSLFNSCNINIPSSLSITLTDQKQEPRNPSSAAETASDIKKAVVNKNLTAASSSSTHKVPSPPVHNFIEILKIPDTEPKKQNKSDTASENRSNTPSKTETLQPKPNNKSSESSAKGPIPNLKPIADTKLGKQSGSAAGPITFQQTFEQQLQTLQTDKKSKVPKNKAQVPKLVPANPKTFSAATKLNNPLTKPNPSSVLPLESKPSTALDLSTPPNIQSQLAAHQTKAFETMQSIANLAKKQNLSPKVPQPLFPQSFTSTSNRPAPPTASLRLPNLTNPAQMKLEKMQPNNPNLPLNTARQETSKSNPVKSTNSPSPSIPSPNYLIPSHNLPSPAQPSPRQTRSPSSSPKLVIAEEKQINPPEINMNQSNQISSTQTSNSASKIDSPKPTPGPSKPGPKPMKPIPQVNKLTGPIRQPITPTVKPNPTPADFQLISAHHAFLRHMEVNAWLKAQRFMSNMAHQAQNDFNKDKQ